MARTTVTQIKRGPYIAFLLKDEKQQFHLLVELNGKKIKEGEKSYYDQEEAEIELGALIDQVWREASGVKDKLVRRL